VAALHLLAAQLSLVLVVIGAAWLGFLATTRRTAGPMLYGALVWVLVAIGAAGLVGLVLALTSKPPSDPLHVLYGVLAAAALPGGALIARDRAAGQRTVVLAITMTVLLILVVRLFQTGG
jgi:hypothetical protein